MQAKPFLKWAGGKSQLLNVFQNYYPEQLKQGKIKRYIEPFVGSGAVLFDILQQYPIEEAFIIDINPELINTYQVVKKDVDLLIHMLTQMESKYLSLSLEDGERKEYYYSIRESFNSDILTSLDEYTERNISRAAELIFLNRTCFNGLYRVNKSGKFNVPMGSYKNPTICNAKNLAAVNQLLQRVNILQGNYKDSRQFIIKDNTFVYFDPPYRPLNQTSSFTSYSKDSFDDEQQIELAKFYYQLSDLGVKLMLSNSDPKNVDVNDTFFEKLYAAFHIGVEQARRVINSKSDKRGLINELIITNYPVEIKSWEETQTSKVV